MTGFQRSEVVIVSFTATKIKLFASAISRIKKVPLITNEEKLMNARKHIYEGRSACTVDLNIQLAKKRYTRLYHKPYVNEVTLTEHNLY